MTTDRAVAAPRSSWWRMGSMVDGLPAQARSELRGVVIVSFGISIGIGVIFPLLPGFGREMGLSLGSIGLLVSVFGVSRLVIDALGGPLFRRWSERQLAVVGAVVVAVGSGSTAVASSFGGLFLARMLHGVGVALFVNAGQVFLGREAPATHRARALSLHQGSMLLGTAVGPVVGGVLASIGGVRLPFVVAALMGAAAAPWSHRLFPPRRAGYAQAETRGPRIAKELRWTLAVAFLSYLVVWGTRSSVRFTLIPLFVEESLGEPVLWSSVILTILAAGDVAGFAFGGHVADRHGRRSLLVVGFFLSAASVGLFALCDGVVLMLPVAVVFGLVGGLVGSTPAAMAADVAGRRPSTMTTLRLAGDFGIMVGPFAATASANAAGYGAAFLMHGAMFALVGLVSWTARETRNQAGDGTYDPSLGRGD